MAEIDLKMGSINDLDLPSKSDKLKINNDLINNKKEPVVSNDDIRIKKRGFLKTFKKSMISDDAESIGGYVLKDIVIPTIKDLIFDSIRGALEIALWGGSKSLKSWHNKY